jgi:hypothetical protein
MNRYRKPQALIPKMFTAFIALVAIGGLLSALCYAQPGSNPPAAKTNSVDAKANPPAKNPPPPKKELSGAELYSMHCNRCHPERYPSERTSAQWKTITLHMQVRANLPPDQAKKILKYLQDNSGY